MTQSSKVEFIGLYVIPGEGTVAALREAAETQLFDKQGLEWKIIEKKKAGDDTEVEEQALAQIRQSDVASNGFY